MSRATSAHPSTITVLLVDDDRRFGELVAEFLENEPRMDVVTETNAADALDVLSEREIDCIVSDYEMPGMDGLELLEAVRDRDSELPFLLFAGQGNEAVASRAIHAGADDYLQKDTGTARYELLANRIVTAVTVARQQRELRELHEAVEHAGHALLVADSDGTIEYVNPSFERITGYSEEEAVGERPSLLKSGEHDEEFYDDLWSTILDGDIWEGEVVNERKDGTRFVIEQTIAPVVDADGEIERFVAINRDVTERKEREQRLQFFEQAIEQVGVGVAAYDSDGRITYANSRYAEMLGLERDQLRGEHVGIINPEFDVGRFQEYWQSFDQNETRVAEGVHQRLDDGTEFPVETVTTRVTIQESEYHIGTIRDITERKRRESDLRKFKQACDHAGHAILIADRDGTVEYVNPSFERVTGYAREDVLGKDPSVLQSGEHDEEFYEELWETILDGDIWEGEVVNERKDGTRFIIEQTIAPIVDDDGDVERFVAINNDITDIKEYERELERQNERLESFGRTVAHDLRNPITIVRGNLKRALQSETVEEPLGNALEATNRMETLVEELLELAKQGQVVLDPDPVSLRDVAATAWNHVETGEGSLDVEGDGVVEMDRSRGMELFENLFRNAVEHAGESPTVRVGELESGGFYIADDGPGIPEADRESVLESGYTTSEDGTGFGLAIVKQIADAHGWETSITESWAGGARFEFREHDDHQ
jgi:PAS domain S-box-containing protein